MESRSQRSGTVVDPRTSLAMWLRAGRAQRKLSLEDVAKITKIQPRILEKLESGELDGLPAEVFVKGFVRSFAKCVGLSESEALERYSAAQAGQATAVAKALIDTMSTTVRLVEPKPLVITSEDAAAIAPVAASVDSEKPLSSAPSVETAPVLETASLETASLETASVETASLETASLETASIETAPSAAEPTVESPTVEAAQDVVAAATVASAEESVPAKKKRTRKKSTTAAPTLAAPTVAAAPKAAKAPRSRKKKTTVMPIVEAAAVESAVVEAVAVEAAAVEAVAVEAVAAQVPVVEAVETEALPETTPFIRMDSADVVADATPASATAVDTTDLAELHDATAFATSLTSEYELELSFGGESDGTVENVDRLAEGSQRISSSAIEVEDLSSGTWQPTMPPMATSSSVPWRRPQLPTATAYVVPTLVIDDADPDSADREREHRAAKDNPRLSFLPPILLDREDRSARQGGLTLAVIILLIAATLTLSYLMRRPSASGDGVTLLDGQTQLYS